MHTLKRNKNSVVETLAASFKWEREQKKERVGMWESHINSTAEEGWHFSSVSVDAMISAEPLQTQYAEEKDSV